MRKAEAPITAPTGKWGIARGSSLATKVDYPFDPEGQGAGARQIMQEFYILFLSYKIEGCSKSQ